MNSRQETAHVSRAAKLFRFDFILSCAFGWNKSGALLLLAAFPAFGATDAAREIVDRSLNADHRNIQLTADYTYVEHEVDRELDGRGNAKKTKVETHEILFIGGKRYEHLIERDDKPLTGEDARKEQARIDRAAREAEKLTPQERDRRLANYERDVEKDLEYRRWIPQAFHFKQQADQMLSGRAAYVVDAEPNGTYRGKYDNLLRNVRGRLFIDKQTLEWVRVEVEVLNDISFGLFLAKLSKGTRVSVEQNLINGEVWLPKEIMVKASARLLVKHENVEIAATYRDYKKFSSSARIVSMGDAE